MEELNKAVKDLGGIKIPQVTLDTSSVDSDPFIVKAKKWMLIGFTGLIAGGAAILIIVSLIKKFL
jgi:hypothetical protein